MLIHSAHTLQALWTRSRKSSIADHSRLDHGTTKCWNSGNKSFILIDLMQQVPYWLYMYTVITCKPCEIFRCMTQRWSLERSMMYMPPYSCITRIRRHFVVNPQQWDGCYTNIIKNWSALVSTRIFFGFGFSKIRILWLLLLWFGSQV